MRTATESLELARSHLVAVPLTSHLANNNLEDSKRVDNNNPDNNRGLMRNSNSSSSSNSNLNNHNPSKQVCN